MKRFAIGISIMLALAGVAFAQSDLQPLAVVKLNKSETITLKQLKAHVSVTEKQYQAYGVNMTSEQKVKMREQMLESMIANKLIAQQAAKEGLSVTDTQVTAAFVGLFNQGGNQNVTEAQLEEECKKATGKSLSEYIKEQTGMTVAEYKNQVKEQLMVQQYIFAKKGAEVKNIAATDKEIRDFYELNKASLVWDDMAKLFLVAVPKGNDAEAAKKKATDMMNQISKNQAKRSEMIAASDNGKAYQAGEILVHKNAQTARMQGWTMDNLNELFEKKVGYTSELIDASTNYQFYSILKKYDAKMLGISDLVQPETNVTVYEYIKGNLTNNKQSQALQVAAQALVKSLDTKENVDRKKTGDALTKLLSW